VGGEQSATHPSGLHDANEAPDAAPDDDPEEDPDEEVDDVPAEPDDDPDDADPEEEADDDPDEDPEEVPDEPEEDPDEEDAGVDPHEDPFAPPGISGLASVPHALRARRDASPNGVQGDGRTYEGMFRVGMRGPGRRVQSAYQSCCAESDDKKRNGEDT
jgi:hypothetical protein